MGVFYSNMPDALVCYAQFDGYFGNFYLQTHSPGSDYYDYWYWDPALTAIVLTYDGNGDIVFGDSNFSDCNQDISAMDPSQLISFSGGGSEASTSPYIIDVGSTLMLGAILMFFIAYWIIGLVKGRASWNT